MAASSLFTAPRACPGGGELRVSLTRVVWPWSRLCASVLVLVSFPLPQAPDPVSPLVPAPDDAVHRRGSDLDCLPLGSPAVARRFHVCLSSRNGSPFNLVIVSSFANQPRRRPRFAWFNVGLFITVALHLHLLAASRCAAVLLPFGVRGLKIFQRKTMLKC